MLGAGDPADARAVHVDLNALRFDVCSLAVRPWVVEVPDWGPCPARGVPRHQGGRTRPCTHRVIAHEPPDAPTDDRSSVGITLPAGMTAEAARKVIADDTGRTTLADIVERATGMKPAATPPQVRNVPVVRWGVLCGLHPARLPEVAVARR